MTKKDSADKVYKETLAGFRSKNLQELEKNLAILKDIRDSDDERITGRVQIDAIKEINLLLGARAPERTSATKQRSATPQKLEEGEEELIDSITKRILEADERRQEAVSP